MCPSNSTSCIYPRGPESIQERHLHPVALQLLTGVETWKQPKCPGMDEQLEKMAQVHSRTLLGYKKGCRHAGRPPRAGLAKAGAA